MTNLQNVLQDFTAWELESIFHMASNESMKAGSPFFEKYRALASKAINQRGTKFPDYLDQYKKVVAK